MNDILCHDIEHPAQVRVVVTEDSKLRVYIGPWLRLQVECETIVIIDGRVSSE